MRRARDAQWMKQALANAEKGWGQTAPNPMVGAVVVSDDDTAVADGWHERYGEAHAEVMALRAAGVRAKGATIYVTLEPCAHHGKTPPCVDAIIEAGIARVVVAVRDPNPLAAGGLDRLRAAGVEVDVGVEAELAFELNAAFFNSFTSHRPWITLKLAVSADGAVADPTGQRRWITGEAARREVHRMRANIDAVAVGRGTVEADDPELTVREGPVPRRQPTRIVFDSSASTSLDAKVVRTAHAVPTIIVARHADPEVRRNLEERSVTVIEAAGLPDAMTALRAAGIQSVLLEGGPRLAGAFLHAGLVDRVALFRAPFELGPDALQAFEFAPDGFARELAGRRVVQQGSFGDDSLVVSALAQ